MGWIFSKNVSKWLIELGLKIHVMIGSTTLINYVVAETVSHLEKLYSCNYRSGWALTKYQKS